MIKIVEKYDKDEPICVGDLLSYWTESDKVTRACIEHWRDYDKNAVIGICTSISGSTVTYTNRGLVDVNVTGLVCLGDKLTISDKPGIAKAIKYHQDETKFRVRHIGKVVELYNKYNVVKVLLDIE